MSPRRYRVVQWATGNTGHLDVYLQQGREG